MLENFTFPDHSVLLVLGLLLLVQLPVAISTVIFIRKYSRRYEDLATELHALVRRIEALTATRREQILKHYDKLLKKLSLRIPPTIADHLGQTIFEAESRILKRLAELEPALQRDSAGRQKLEEMIRVMEDLEQTLVLLTSDVVKSVMLESRTDLLDEEKFLEEHLAA